MTDPIFSELVTFNNSQGSACRGMLLSLSKSHAVFEVYNPYSIVQLSEVLNDLKINRAQNEIYNGKAVVTNIVNTGVLLIVSATLSSNYWKSIFDITSKEEVTKEINQLIKDFELEEQVDQEFKMSVLSMKSFLTDVKTWFEKIEHSFEGTTFPINTNFITNQFAPLYEKMAEIYDKINQSAKRIKSDQLAVYINFVQSHFHPLIMSSPFCYRIYTKPLGYAGDYEMMNMIQRENAEGPNLFAKFINIFYTNIPVTTSVRNRTATLVELIKEGVDKAEKRGDEFHSFSIGCGPALEVKNFIRDNNPKIKCNFKLLDFNKQTLDAAKKTIDSVNDGFKNCNVTYQQDSVHVLLKKSVNREVEEQQYDLVYCSGLFDYLSDRICSKLTRMFYSLLKPGGKVLVTNMHSDCQYQTMTELVFEWHLIYRDEKDLAAFVPNLGRQRLFKDETGINLCLEITR